MVDISGKVATSRQATVRGVLLLQEAHLSAIHGLPKGNALLTAQIAGIQGGKKAAELIPLCHPVTLTHLEVSVQLVEDKLEILATASTDAPTGVEMEAYAAVVTAGITLIDMLKGVDPDLTLTDVQLVSKIGGKQPYQRQP
jgi:cyclic pyranopterin phosphate synthase